MYDPVKNSEAERKVDPVRYLRWCWKCKENSVARKCYTRKDGVKKRIEYCVNYGCGYSLDLGDVE